MDYSLMLSDVSLCVVIIEYLLKISIKACILKLKQRHLKITFLTSNTPYPYGVSILALHKRPRRKQDQYAVSRDDQYAVFKLWKKYILEDIKRGLYFKKSLIHRLRKKYRLSLKNDMPPQDKPKIDDKDSFELKGQFLKELRNNTFSGLDHEDANKHIEKVLDIVDLFHIPNITQDQVMLRAFPMSHTGAKSRWLRNKPSSSITIWEDLKTKFLSKYYPPAHTAKKMEEINNFQQEPDETPCTRLERFKELLMKCPKHYLMEMQEVILFYNVLDVQTRHILDSKGVIPSKTTADVKVAIQEMAEYSKKWHNRTSRTRSTETSGRLAVHTCTTLLIFEENSRKVNEQKDPGSFTLLCHINNVCFDNALADLGASISVMPLLTYLNLGLGELAKLTVELADRIMKYPKRIAKNVLVGIGKFVFPVDFIILDMPEDVKVPLILGRLFLSTAHAKIDVFKRKITLRVGDEKIIFKSVKPTSSLIKRVYMLNLRERMELDLEARLMGETLVINRSLDPLYGNYIELNDLNVPLELRRDQVDDLMPTIEEGE
ncbi:putative ribonuclease H-like domain-containing protein, partial [Tanacetum coccineum]